jgi:hypothetical protein
MEPAGVEGLERWSRRSDLNRRPADYERVGAAYGRDPGRRADLSWSGGPARPRWGRRFRPRLSAEGWPGRVHYSGLPLPRRLHPPQARNRTHPALCGRNDGPSRPYLPASEGMDTLREICGRFDLGKLDLRPRGREGETVLPTGRLLRRLPWPSYAAPGQPAQRVLGWDFHPPLEILVGEVGKEQPNPWHTRGTVEGEKPGYSATVGDEETSPKSMIPLTLRVTNCH